MEAFRKALAISHPQLLLGGEGCVFAVSDDEKRAKLIHRSLFQSPFIERELADAR